MSGGEFDYREYHLLEIAEAIEEELSRQDTRADTKFLNKALLDVASDLKQMYSTIRELDKWLSGDIHKEDFIKQYNIFRSRRGRVAMEE